MALVAVSGAFDDLRSGEICFLEEASKVGEVTAYIWDDAAATAQTGTAPKFPSEERRYVVAALRYVRQAIISPAFFPSERPAASTPFPAIDIFAVRQKEDRPEYGEFCRERGIEYRLIPEASLAGFPGPPFDLRDQGFPHPWEPARKKVVVTGCYDWLHSGHIRFFEEASAFGDLFVDVGSDANIRLLKGPGHPLFPQAERLYMVRAARAVHAAFIGTGTGWMDAVPEIEFLRPDFYVVNEDGDRLEKREFCASRGIEYVVLRRLPAPGLSRRDSTTLRGF